MRATRMSLCGAVLILLLAGCVPKTVTLQPGETSWGDAQEGGVDAWSVWVQEVRDLRPNAAEGAKVGLFHPRLQAEPQTVYVKPLPAEYVRNELSRFLLHRGLEASEQRRAKLLLRLELTEFSMAEDPGSVMDTITVRVEYTVHFLNQQQVELGSLRLEGSGIIQTPVSVPRKTQQAFRDAVADTFRTLAKNEVFGRALSQVR